MSKGDKYFEKIGYRKVEEDTNLLKYENKKKNKRIYFKEKTIRSSYYNVTKEYPGIIDMSELKGIHLKCKELGWI